MSPSKVLTLAVIAVSSSAPLVVAQFKSSYNCDKYCFDDCSKYFGGLGGSEFSACVSANVHCSCNAKLSLKNPVLIFILVALIFLTCFICAFCHRFCVHGHRRPNPSSRSIAYPIPPITATPGTTGANSRRNSNTNNDNRRTSSQRNVTEGIVNPLAPQKSNDIPPEYLAPPPYNECVINMHTDEKSDKSQNC